MDLKQNIKSGSHFKKILVQRLIHSWSSSGKLRKTAFLHKLASKGLLTLNDHYLDREHADKFATCIDSMITVLNRVHENNWDFHLEPYYNGYNVIKSFELSIKILYPEVIITNSREEARIIKDLIVRIDLKSRIIGNVLSLVPTDIKGTRASFEYEEWFAGYNHSHLPSYKPVNYTQTFLTSSFCIGDGTELENTKIQLQNYQEEIFELFLYNIDTMVRWESREGVPYISMSKVVPITESTYQPSMNPSKPNLVIWFNSIYCPSNYDIEYVFADNRFKIKQNHIFDRYIKSVVLATHDINTIKNCIIKDVGNTYYGFTQTETEHTNNEVFKYDNQLPYTLIQGRKIEFKRKDFQGEMPDINNYKTHPKFLEYVAEQLEQQLYYKAVRRSAIEG